LQSGIRSAGFWAAIFAAYGVIARFIVYIQCPSLWDDELFLALSIAPRPFSELFSPLDFQQVAPIGFVIVQRLAVSLFGTNEYALRAFPFVCSLVLLPSVWIITKRLFGPWPAAIAVCLISVSFNALRYAAEAKPYGVDMCVSAAILAVAAYMIPTRMTLGRSIGLITFGLLSLTFSIPSVFLLAGLGAALVWRSLTAEVNHVQRIQIAVIVIVWLLAAVFTYVTFYSDPETTRYMRDYWEGTALDQADPAALISRLADGYVEPLVAINGRVPFPVYLFTLFLVITGLVVTPRSCRMEVSATMIAAFVCPVLAGLVGMWVFNTRLMLFTVPATAALAGLACWRVAAGARTVAGRQAAVGVVAAILVSYPARTGTYAVRHPENQALRQAVKFAMDQYRVGDIMYVYSRAMPAWIFYSTNWGLPDRDRLDWLMRASAATGPNAGNRLPRGRVVTGEGETLKRPYRGGWEVVGVGEGIFRRGRDERLLAAPDPGWAANEYRRVADLRRSRVIVLGLSPGVRGVTDLVAYFHSAGCREVARFDGLAAMVVVFDLPVAAHNRPMATNSIKAVPDVKHPLASGLDPRD
jgi:hypothetical protein